MNRYRQLIITALFILATGNLTAADIYEIDTSHSQVSFGVKHLGLSTVKGDFTKYEGSIMLDEKDLSKSSVQVTIDANSINTANAKRDSHLKGDDFFATEKYPKITFISKKITKKGKQWQAIGDLTMRGVTKEVAIPFTLNGPIASPFDTTNIGVDASLAIDRQDWGISWNKTLDKGGFVVGNDVAINLSVEAIKKEPKLEAKPEMKDATKTETKTDKKK